MPKKQNTKRDAFDREYDKVQGKRNGVAPAGEPEKDKKSVRRKGFLWTAFASATAASMALFGMGGDTPVDNSKDTAATAPQSQTSADTDTRADRADRTASEEFSTNAANTSGDALDTSDTTAPDAQADNTNATPPPAYYPPGYGGDWADHYYNYNYGQYGKYGPYGPFGPHYHIPY